MAAPTIHRDANGSCFRESGCYQFYYLKNGSGLEGLRFVAIDHFNHAAGRLTEVDGKFPKQNMRDLVPEILQGLKDSAKPVFSEVVRFPRRGTYVLLDTQDYVSIETGLTSASKYSDKDDERDATLPGGSKSIMSKTVDPNNPRNDTNKWAFNNAATQFNKMLQRFKNYAINKMHSFTRINFEKDYNLIWCCDDCCAPPKCVLECEDTFQARKPIKVPPKKPHEPSDPEGEAKLKWFQDVIYETNGNYVEDWAVNLDNLTKLDCWKNDDYTVLEDRYIRSAPDGLLVFLNSARNDDYRPYMEFKFSNRTYKSDRLKCKDESINIKRLESLLKSEKFKPYDIGDPRILVGDSDTMDCDLLNSAVILRKNREFALDSCGLLVLHDKDNERVAVFYYNLKTDSSRLLETIDCHLDEN